MDKISKKNMLYFSDKEVLVLLRKMKKENGVSMKKIASLMCVLSLVVGMLSTGIYTRVEETKADNLQTVYTYDCDSSKWGLPVENWSWEYRGICNDLFYNMKYVKGQIDKEGKIVNRYIAYNWADNEYASIYGNGKNMHPGDKVDVVKTFTAPRTGRVKLDITIGKDDKDGDGITFCIYLNDKKVYPLGGDPITIVGASDVFESCTVDVNKGDKIRYVIGKNVNRSRDSTHMTNTITYVSEQKTEPVVTSDQYNNQIVAFDLKGINTTKNKYRVKSAVGYDSKCAPVDAKLRYHKKLRKAFIVATFSSSIKIIDPDTWKEYSSIPINKDDNIHGVEMLPNGTIVAAYAGSNRVVFIETDNKMKQKKDKKNKGIQTPYGLNSAHAVLYDPVKEVTWAIGDGFMRSYTYNESSYKPTASALYQFNKRIDNANGSNTKNWINAHYLIQNPYDSNELLIAVHAGLIKFDKKKAKFSGYKYEEQPKTFFGTRLDGIKSMVMSDNNIYYTFAEDYDNYKNANNSLRYYSWTSDFLYKWSINKVGSYLAHTERTRVGWQNKLGQNMRVYRVMPFVLQ